MSMRPITEGPIIVQVWQSITNIFWNQWTGGKKVCYILSNYNEEDMPIEYRLNYPSSINLLFLTLWNTSKYTGLIAEYCCYFQVCSKLQLTAKLPGCRDPRLLGYQEWVRQGSQGAIGPSARWGKMPPSDAICSLLLSWGFLREIGRSSLARGGRGGAVYPGERENERDRGRE